MASTIFGRRNRPRRIWSIVIAGVISLLLLGGYIHLLQMENRDVVVELTDMRQSDPVHYLEAVRERKGFLTYLSELRARDGYDQYQSVVPPFLLARWAMYDQPKRVGYQYVAPDCSNFMAIEDGKIKLVGHKNVEYPVRYRISGATVDARMDDGKVIPIRLVSFGMDLHHIVVQLPGNAKPVYGYLCK